MQVARGHIKVNIYVNVFTLTKRGLLILTKRLPRKRNKNWRTFNYFQK